MISTGQYKNKSLLKEKEFKIDENLPTEFAEILQEAGYDAMTVHQQKLKGEKDPILLEICQQEGRILVTLDLDFANIRNGSISPLQ